MEDNDNKDRVVFKWGLTLSDLVQLVFVGCTAAAIWYSLVNDVKQNTKQIRYNKEAIIQIHEKMGEMVDDMKRSNEIMEARLMGHIQEIKENVTWLVRQKAESRRDSNGRARD